MSLLQLGIQLFLIVQKVFSCLMLLLPHALCLWVPESSRASVLQVCGHMVISEVFALIILGCESLRRSPRISGLSKAHRPQEGLLAFLASLRSYPFCALVQLEGLSCFISIPRAVVLNLPNTVTHNMTPVN